MVDEKNKALAMLPLSGSSNLAWKYFNKHYHKYFQVDMLKVDQEESHIAVVTWYLLIKHVFLFKDIVTL